MVRVVCMSDIHSMMHRFPADFIPEGDILVIAGDLTSRGRLDEIEEVNTRLGMLPHLHKVIIAGNHDWAFQTKPDQARALITNAIYLEDSEVTVEGLRIWGSPWQPFFYDWAFNLRRGTPIKKKWDLIPDGIDILITHGPPAGVLDLVPSGEAVGCADLLTAVSRVKPQLHVFGHIHHSYGVVAGVKSISVNASTCDEGYSPVNVPIVVGVSPREVK